MEAEAFLARQIAWGHSAMGWETETELRWLLDNHDLGSVQKPAPKVLKTAGIALNKAWDEGPEGVRSRNGASQWQRQVGIILKGPLSSGSRLVLAAWLRTKAAGTLPEDRMVFDMGGFGTGLFGMEDLREDGSYRATKFVVALHLPLIPLGSFRVREGPRSLEMGMAFGPRSYEIVEQCGMQWPQVIRGWAFSVSCMTVIMLAARCVEILRPPWGMLFLALAVTLPYWSKWLYRRYRRFTLRNSVGC